jgi:DNA-binding transcriptional LysR family regulator
MFAWDDISVFLALYRERTTSRAAAALGVSQPTVVRRLASLEQALGLTLFERTPTGLVPADAALKLLNSAERVERAICELTAEVDLLTASDLDVIRVTLVDHFERLLIPVLRQFRSRWPGVQTELLASNRLYDLARGEADIAMRGRRQPEGDEVVVRELPQCGWTVYASVHSCPSERPSTPDEVARYPLAVFEGARHLPIYRWLESLGGSGSVTSCSHIGALRSLTASGGAIAGLPCTVGDVDAELVRCFPPPPEFNVPIYIAARRAVLRRPAARDLFDTMTSYFQEHPTLLTGLRD